jgi:hypothetical protein
MHFVVPEQIRFPATSWELMIPEVAREPFIGGYFAPDGQDPQWEITEKSLALRKHPLRLDYSRGTFLGLTQSVFKNIVSIARGVFAFGEVPRFDRIVQVHSALSMLGDGSVLGPIEFFRPIGFPIY